MNKLGLGPIRWRATKRAVNHGEQKDTSPNQRELGFSKASCRHSRKKREVLPERFTGMIDSYIARADVGSWAQFAGLGVTMAGMLSMLPAVAATLSVGTLGVGILGAGILGLGVGTLIRQDASTIFSSLRHGVKQAGFSEDTLRSHFHSVMADRGRSNTRGLTDEVVDFLR